MSELPPFQPPPGGYKPAWRPPFTPEQAAVGMGVVGGLGIAKMIYDHAFVRGFTSKERKNLAIAGVGVVGAGALIYLWKVDRKYVLTEDAMAALEEWVGKQKF